MTSTKDEKREITNLSPEELRKMANPPRLIDVRSNLEYRLFHAPEATNLSLPRILMGVNSFLSRWVIPQWFRELPKNEPIALICLSAHRSPMAAKKLQEAGFTQVYNITGGMMAWKELGLPISKGKEPS